MLPQIENMLIDVQMKIFLGNVINYFRNEKKVGLFYMRYISKKGFMPCLRKAVMASVIQLCPFSVM